MESNKVRCDRLSRHAYWFALGWLAGGALLYAAQMLERLRDLA